MNFSQKLPRRSRMWRKSTGSLRSSWGLCARSSVRGYRCSKDPASHLRCGFWREGGFLGQISEIERCPAPKDLDRRCRRWLGGRIAAMFGTSTRAMLLEILAREIEGEEWRLARRMKALYPEIEDALDALSHLAKAGLRSSSASRRHSILTITAHTIDPSYGDSLNRVTVQSRFS